MNNEGKEYFSKTENSRLGKLKTLKNIQSCSKIVQRNKSLKLKGIIRP
jgi:hypothetical protein